MTTAALERPGPEPAVRDAAVRRLSLAAFTSTFDRFSVPPLLVAISVDLGASLAGVTTAATLYYLAYGLSQPIWGLVSDRLGRVRTMRLTLAAAGVVGLAAALAPTLPVLIGTRIVQGALIAAVIPSALTYVGDSYPLSERQAPLSRLIGASAIAQSVSTFAAGVIAQLLSWRVAFAIPALLAFVLVALLRTVPEPPRVESASPLRGIAMVLSRPWALLVLGLALVEGAAVLGALTFFAPALQASGLSSGVAGAVVAVQGVGLVIGSRALSRLAPRVRPAVLIAAGGLAVAAGQGLAAASPTLLPVLAGAVTVGLGFALLHTNLQAWATDVAPAARATAVSLFAASLFCGSAIGTAALATLATAGRFSAVFAVTAGLMVPLTAAAALGRARYRESV